MHCGRGPPFGRGLAPDAGVRRLYGLDTDKSSPQGLSLSAALYARVDLAPALMEWAEVGRDVPRGMDLSAGVGGADPGSADGRNGRVSAMGRLDVSARTMGVRGVPLHVDTERNRSAGQRRGPAGNGVCSFA